MTPVSTSQIEIPKSTLLWMIRLPSSEKGPQNPALKLIWSGLSVDSTVRITAPVSASRVVNFHEFARKILFRPLKNDSDFRDVLLVNSKSAPGRASEGVREHNQGVSFFSAGGTGKIEPVHLPDLPGVRTTALPVGVYPVQRLERRGEWISGSCSGIHARQGSFALPGWGQGRSRLEAQGHQRWNIWSPRSSNRSGCQ